MTTVFPATTPSTEIIADIIDELATDTAVIRDCSMVSVTWRSFALHHLFRLVELFPASRIDSLAALLHANASLGAYIRHVILPHTTLFSLPPLRDVDVLHLIISRFACSTLDDSVAHIGAAFPRVTRLVMISCDLCPNHDMPMKLFRSLPCLRHLDLEDSIHPPCEMPSAQCSPWVCKLDTLRLIHPSPKILHCLADAWRNGISTVENLEYQHVRTIDGEYRDSLLTFMRTTTSLRDVNFRTRTMDKMSSLLHALDFSANKHLRKLTLRCGAAGEEPAKSLVSLIRAIRGLSVHVDVLWISVEPLSPVGPWDLMLEALSTLSSSNETAAEFILELDKRLFMIASLATLERALGAIV